jgi:hypothetical protein
MRVRARRRDELCHAGGLEGGEALGNQPLTDEEKVQIEARIAALEIEHHDLDDVIARLSEHPDQDQLQLRRFKKRKLMLKDSISRLKVMLVPDIPA